MSDNILGLAVDNQQEAENERYTNCLAAIKECYEKGVSLSTIQTLRFEMAINPKDFLAIQDYVLDGLIGEFNDRLKGIKSERVL